VETPVATCYESSFVDPSVRVTAVQSTLTVRVKASVPVDDCSKREEDPEFMSILM